MRAATGCGRATCGHCGKGVAKVPHLTMLELENLRHRIGEDRLAVSKLREYARGCKDSQLKNQLQHIASQLNQDAQRLMTFLG